MAGLVLVVLCAQKRWYHQSSGWSDLENHSRTRPSSLCLYPSNPETHQSSTSFTGRSVYEQAYLDEGLSEAAREAKERLDEKLRALRAGKKKEKGMKPNTA